ncbi:MAG TPA: thiamine phosphate synthase [Rudaea sp.]|nr:thiamine phosphate synthase [Rudaea sp.]
MSPSHLPRPPMAGLYAVTDGPRPDLFAAVDAALRGGCAMVQYRDKSADQARRGAEAAGLLDLCRRFAVPLIINDDVELAAGIGAHGVHVGEHDGDVAEARARLGANAIIGVSCYDSLERARELAAAGADYLAFGAFYPSPTKPHARRATVDLLHAAKPLGLPLVAIGGITPDNAQPLIDAGADLVAVISGVFAAADPCAAARRYANLFTKG